MVRFYLILILLLNFSVYAQVIDYGAWRIIKHPVKQRMYWPDDIAVFNQKNESCYFDQIDDRPILLVFWASWCNHCVNKIASLDMLKKDFKKLPLEIIAISEDYQGVDIIKQFFTQNNIKNLEIFYDQNFKLFGALNMTALPYAFLVDQNKKIVLSFDGAVDWYDDDVRKLILSYIPGEHEEPKNSYKQSSIINKVVQ